MSTSAVPKSSHGGGTNQPRKWGTFITTVLKTQDRKEHINRIDRAITASFGKYGLSLVGVGQEYESFTVVSTVLRIDRYA